MQQFTYLFILIGSLSFPLIFTFHPQLRFYKEWKYLFPAIAIMATFFIVWDHYFTEMGVWNFNDHYTLGIRIWSLPVEEWLFFLVVPYCCVFIYASLNHYFKHPPLEKAAVYITPFLIVLIASIAVLHFNRAYTFTTGFFTVTFFLLLLWKKVSYMGRFYLAYLVSKIPFLIVNGILTALPVVVYNDTENLGIRIYTIPVDDTIYSFLMILMTIAFMEYFKERETRTGKLVSRA